MSEVKLGDVSFITKLAGFEHTKYIQGNNTHEKISEDDVPLFIGKTVQNGKIDRNFDWYIPKQISDQLERSKLNKKCLVLPYVGSVGDLAIFDATYDAHLGSNIAKIELACNSGYSEEFIYYFLKSDYGQKVLLRDIQGAIQKNITMKAIRDVSLPDISIQEQDKIVSILKSLDDKIDNNNQINQELETMAKILYDYWFVQFDFPDQNGKPYKSSGGKMVYHPELKREIPEGWGVENLFDVAEVQYGYPFSTDYFNSIGEGIPVIRIRDILGNDITNYSTEEVEDKYKINVGDVLIGMDGNFHMNYWIKEDCYLNQRVVKVNSDKLPNMVLKYQIEPFIKLREKSVSRTTVGHLSDKDLKAINVILPKEKYLSSIFDKFESILENIIINQQQNQELTQLRDWLLPMLMNGQVKVE